MELKLKWTKYCVLSVAGADNVKNRDSDNPISILSKTQDYTFLLSLY